MCTNNYYSLNEQKLLMFVLVFYSFIETSTSLIRFTYIIKLGIIVPFLAYIANLHLEN